MKYQLTIVLRCESLPFCIRSPSKCQFPSCQEWDEDAGTIWVLIDYHHCPSMQLLTHFWDLIFCLSFLLYFRGRNFVIKYEDSFKSGNSECFILEHVDHDRPEANFFPLSHLLRTNLYSSLPKFDSVDTFFK